jgi:ABC-type multidrug transport system ATPase subunit
MSVVLEAAGLSKFYGDFHAVKGINFHLNTCECLGMLGPNGAGKSSTMKMIYSAISMTSGTIKIAGTDVRQNSREAKRVLGVVSQDDLLDLSLTVMENLVAHAICYDIPLKKAREKAKDLLEFVNLGDRMDALVTSLSGGMRRRVVLARALINDPQVIILDEPTTGLDIHSRHVFWEKLLELKKQGVSMILTSHHMDEVEKLADRLVIIDHGQIIEEGTPNELKIKNGDKSLEDLFLELTGMERYA